MSKEFIQKGVNKQHINDAAIQERQLAYFTQSELQTNNITSSYLTAWAERNYATNDYFLSYVKSVFKTENFLFFFKYLRKPVPSAKLINNKIKPQLNRVFTAENSDFKYDVTNVDQGEIKETLKHKMFEEELFDKLLYKHNSIVIEDLDSDNANEPFRYFVDIDNVKSLDHNGKRITRIAFGGCVEIEDEKIEGFIYIDDDKYQFYSADYKLLLESEHDLGVCPADFITKNKYKENFIIRESLFTYIREELEEYTFLKTLQKMTDPNGALPVVTKLETDSGETDTKGDSNEPNGDNIMGSQAAAIFNEINNNQIGDTQAGTIHEIPLEAIKKSDGTIDMEPVKSYLNFFYLPVDALNYIKTRISDIENSIISTMIGTIDSSNEESKNEMQIEKSIIVLENTLISLADILNHITNKSDWKMLSLKYGKERVNEVFNFYGTDFFLESQSKLFEDLEKAPNPIERKNILIRINQNKFKNNKDQSLRQKILYDLLPYVSDKDFEIARNAGLDSITLQYQLRFTYWIGIFEAQFGDIVTFYIGLDTDAATKLVTINNLILDIIRNNMPETVNNNQS